MIVIDETLLNPPHTDRCQCPVCRIKRGLEKYSPHLESDSVINGNDLYHVTGVYYDSKTCQWFVHYRNAVGGIMQGYRDMTLDAWNDLVRSIWIDLYKEE